MRKARKSKVCSPYRYMISWLKWRFLAVTLDGTVIHKSGLMTGGRSAHGNSKKWDEKDVQGQVKIILAIFND